MLANTVQDRNQLNRLTCLAERKLHGVLTNTVPEINVVVNKYPEIECSCNKYNAMIWDRKYVSGV